ncbi:DNA mismatch endonuclease Vsr [Microbacterium sp. MMO-10]|uniref:DNA mismatch endonuclease Vsr n=1 Tax=Microbacterium sp. MMO-10 TaxID=3081272 RepID=UPI003015961A
MTEVAPHAADRPLAAQPLQRAVHALPFVSLFSGIAGMDSGLVAAGATLVELCESWEPARRVLALREPGVTLSGDVRDFTPTHDHRLLAAGFPCVDLSHAGRQAGIFGASSGLVSEVFRIAEATRPEWLVLENVPNLLRLGRGAGIQLIIEKLEALGYSWAYRVLDSRAFGVAQRRNRVIVLASTAPGLAAQALLGDDTRGVEPFEEPAQAEASGFYWTEGRRGVGLVRGAVPTLKGGSTVGLPSAPAVWRPGAPLGQRIVLPSIEDAEVLQGFERGWTADADRPGEPSARWKLVGNAVTVPLARWVGERIVAADVGRLRTVGVGGAPRDARRPWPDAAYGEPGMQVHAALASKWPIETAIAPLDEVLDHEGLRPLSYRATRGFLSRIEESGITLDNHFLDDLESHLSTMRTDASRVVSWASSDVARTRMQAVKHQNTTPELKLRRALSDLGLRYRLQIRPEADLRWRADILFKGAKAIVDVRGCFWHVCPLHQTHPKANAARWEAKLRGNQERDRRMESELSARGWKVITVWEHEDAGEAASHIAEQVHLRRGQRRQRRVPTLDVTPEELASA